MKAIEFLVEDAEKLKNIVTGLIQQTDDVNLLNKVYNALKAGDVTGRLSAAMSQDADAKKFLDTLTQVVLQTDGTVDEKLAFADNFARGFVDVKSLFSKEKIGYDNFITPGFPQRVFDNLVPIIKQGVGPGELAFSIMSPAIRFTGQETGGGDLQVQGVGYVELKTEQASGGRWINARKANMSLGKIREALLNASQRVIPARVNVAQWVQMREYLVQVNKLKPAQMKTLCGIIAQATFNQVDSSMYAQALLSGTVDDIKRAILTVGYANYQAYSGFDGLLIMSVPKRTAQYFTSITELLPNIKSDTPYILAPESEMMPKVKVTV